LSGPCRPLTRRAALLVLVGAILWLPISFTIATLMHVVLVAKALSLPAWMQFLHPVATVIAKTKLLVLPVYPAAWPQAKQDPAMQPRIRFWHRLIAHYFTREIAHRYLQTHDLPAGVGETLRHAAAATGLNRLGNALLAVVNATAAATGSAVRVTMSRLAELASKTPLLSAIVARYDAHYDAAAER